MRPPQGRCARKARVWHLCEPPSLQEDKKACCLRGCAGAQEGETGAVAAWDVRTYGWIEALSTFPCDL